MNQQKKLFVIFDNFDFLIENASNQTQNNEKDEKKEEEEDTENKQKICFLMKEMILKNENDLKMLMIVSSLDSNPFDQFLHLQLFGFEEIKKPKLFNFFFGNLIEKKLKFEKMIQKNDFLKTITQKPIFFQLITCFDLKKLENSFVSNQSHKNGDIFFECIEAIIYRDSYLHKNSFINQKVEKISGIVLKFFSFLSFYFSVNQIDSISEKKLKTIISIFYSNTNATIKDIEEQNLSNDDQNKVDIVFERFEELIFSSSLLFFTTKNEKRETKFVEESFQQFLSFYHLNFFVSDLEQKKSFLQILFPYSSPGSSSPSPPSASNLHLPFFFYFLRENKRQVEFFLDHFFLSQKINSEVNIELFGSCLSEIFSETNKDIVLRLIEQKQKVSNKFFGKLLTSISNDDLICFLHKSSPSLFDISFQYQRNFSHQIFLNKNRDISINLLEYLIENKLKNILGKKDQFGRSSLHYILLNCRTIVPFIQLILKEKLESKLFEEDSFSRTPFDLIFYNENSLDFDSFELIKLVSNQKEKKPLNLLSHSKRKMFNYHI